MSAGILYREEGHVARVTIDRPAVMNALDAEAEAELRRIWAELEGRREIWAVVLTGAGEKAFCTGADMSAAAVKVSGLEYWAKPRPDGFGGLAARRSLLMPVIAAVNGYALGGGLELVLGCDLVVAAEEARFGLPEARVGRLPMDGGVFLLPRQVPARVAMGMMLTGRHLSAADALGYGLVNEVVPRAELAAAVDRWVDDVLRCAPLSLRAIKQMVGGSQGMAVEDALQVGFPALIEALRSRDADEGVAAFREKRAPVWRAE